MKTLSLAHHDFIQDNSTLITNMNMTDVVYLKGNGHLYLSFIGGIFKSFLLFVFQLTSLYPRSFKVCRLSQDHTKPW